jgi:hypothetical protein
MSDLVCIKKYNNRLDAEMAKNYLEVYEIEATINVDDAGGAYPFPLSGGVKLKVRKEDAQKAIEVLESSYDIDDVDIQ